MTSRINRNCDKRHSDYKDEVKISTGDKSATLPVEDNQEGTIRNDVIPNSIQGKNPCLVHLLAYKKAKAAQKENGGNSQSSDAPYLTRLEIEYNSDSSSDEDEKKNTKCNPDPKIWYVRFEEAKQFVEDDTKFTQKDRKRVKNWIWNLRKMKLTPHMTIQAWETGFYQVFEDDEIISSYDVLRKDKAFKRWKKYYIKKRRFLSDERKNELIKKKIFKEEQIFKPIRIFKNRKRTIDET